MNAHFNNVQFKHVHASTQCYVPLNLMYYSLFGNESPLGIIPTSRNTREGL